MYVSYVNYKPSVLLTRLIGLYLPIAVIGFKTTQYGITIIMFRHIFFNQRSFFRSKKSPSRPPSSMNFGTLCGQFPDKVDCTVTVNTTHLPFRYG